MIKLDYEKFKFSQNYKFVIGVDEVGRGSLAGPVVAAAVVFPQEFFLDKELVKNLKDVNDSKKIQPIVRKRLCIQIMHYAKLWSVGVVSSKVIDRINIHNASLKAMSQAVSKIVPGLLSSKQNHSLNKSNAFLFVDGKFTVPKVFIDQQSIIRGDEKVFSVASASIIAKVYRDELMSKLHVKLPQYEFANHKGYATLEHRQRILQHGLSKYHRISFCRKYLD